MESATADLPIAQTTIRLWLAPSNDDKVRVRGGWLTQEPDLCYSIYALVKTGAGIAGKDSVWIWNLARDCEPPYPPQTFYMSLDAQKPRWLLWLEGPSLDESRRAAAALHLPGTAMLTQ